MYHHKYIKDIFDRADLRNFREFLVAGLELDELAAQSYSQQLKKASALIVKRIESIAKDEDELDEIYSEFACATDAYMQVFLEIGMKTGVKLFSQLIS